MANDSSGPKKLRGADDIRRDLEAIKKEVEGQKDKADEATKEFLSDLDKSVNTTIGEIQNKKERIETQVKQAYDSAHTEGEAFIGAYRSYDRRMLKTIWLLLVAMFLAIGALFVSLLQGYYLGIIVGALGVTFLVFYFGIRRLVIPDPKEMKKLIVGFSTSLTLKDLESNHTLKKSGESGFSHLKKVTAGLLASVSKFIPGMNGVYSELSLLTRYEQKVRKFESALRFHNVHITNGPEFFDSLSSNAPGKDRIIDNESDWGDHIVESINSRLSSDKPDMSADVIVLLQKEHAGEDTRSVFRRIKEDKKAVGNLARILYDSGKLTPPQGALTYGPDDVGIILKSLEDFHLSLINTLLSDNLRRLDYIQTYSDFLEKNGVKIDKPNLKFILDNADSRLITLEDQVINLAYKFGLIFYKRLLKSGEFSDGFARASVTIKFNDEISLRKAACQLSYNPYAAAVLRAYLDKGKQHGGKEVTMEELIAGLKDVKSFFKQRDDIEFRWLESKLKEGTWYDTQSDFHRAFLEEKTKQVMTEIGKIQKYTLLKEAVSKTFEEVGISTIEKAIDAQAFSAYLIISSSSAGGGEFAPLVNKLSRRALEREPRERQWEPKDQSAINEIKRKYGVAPSYDFIKFTYGTWIGVLKKSTLFMDFKQKFCGDLNKILATEGHVNKNAYNIGLAIQRITPSKYSFGILDDTPFNVSTKDLAISKYVAKLAIDNVPEEEQAGIIAFDKEVSMLKILDTKSIYEIIKVENDDIDNNERLALESQKLKEEVLLELKNIFGAQSLGSLAIDLSRKVIPIDAVSGVIHEVLSKKKLKRANSLSIRFANSLRDMAEVYEIQHK